MTFKRDKRREVTRAIEPGGSIGSVARAVAAVLRAERLEELQHAVPGLLAAVVDAEVVLLVDQRDGEPRVLAWHGPHTSGEALDPGRDAALLALELGEPVCFEPGDRPANVESALAMPLALGTGPAVAVSCHRAAPFDQATREALDALASAIAQRWRVLAPHPPQDALEARFKLQERKLRELAERLERNDKLKQEFVATMSHELRTPLNVVLGFTSLLADQAFGALTPEQDEACQKILESSERLAQLINDLLDVGRLEAGTLQFNFQPLELGEMLAETLEEFRPIADQRNLALELDVAPGPHEIEADGDRLRQVVAHLLDNALKFTEPSGRVGIRLEDPTPAGGVAIEVWDTGIGIPENARHRLFERFYQVDSSNTRLYGGTGLGLALVKEFVERHGGSVSLESQLGKGSRFRLDLPRSATEALASSDVILE